jgi:hypothetical protein
LDLGVNKVRINPRQTEETSITGLNVLGLVGLNDEAFAFKRLTVVGDAGVDGMPAGVEVDEGNL